MKSWQEYGEDCDWVLSRNEYDPSGEVRPRKVLNRQVRIAEIWNVHLRDQVIGTTREHPFFVKGKGWVPAGELQIGDRVAGSSTGWTTVEGTAPSGRVDLVYNFHVEEDRTYFVGEVGWGWDVWVHNTHITGEAPKTIADTVSGSRNAALRAAKQANGIPLSAQPIRTIKPNTPEGIKLGLDDRNVLLHEYVNSAGEKIHIRLDKPAGFGQGGVGDQGRHFNAGPAFNKLKQHHFFGE